MLYRVVWEVEVEAKNEIAAAKLALEMQRDKDSIATVFKVSRKRKEAKCLEVDLIGY